MTDKPKCATCNGKGYLWPYDNEMCPDCRPQLNKDDNMTRPKLTPSLDSRGPDFIHCRWCHKDLHPDFTVHTCHDSQEKCDLPGCEDRPGSYPDQVHTYPKGVDYDYECANTCNICGEPREGSRSMNENGNQIFYLCKCQEGEPAASPAPTDAGAVDVEAWLQERWEDALEGEPLDLEDVRKFVRQLAAGLSSWKVHAQVAIGYKQKAEAKLKLLKEQYYDLIMCVEDKYPNESRHETAKRLLMIRNTGDGQAKTALKVGP